MIHKNNEAVDFHEVAAYSYLELGNKEKAIHHFKETFKLNPGYHGSGEMLDSLNVGRADLLEPIEYTKKELESFVGYYTDGENECHITLEGDSLKVLLKEHYFTISDELVTFGIDHFYIPDNYYTIEFIKSQKSKASHLIVHETTGWSNKMIRMEDY